MNKPHKLRRFRRFWTWLANLACSQAYGKPVIVLQGELDYERSKLAQLNLALEDLRSRAHRVWKEHGHSLAGKPKDTAEWLALQEALEKLS